MENRTEQLKYSLSGQRRCIKMKIDTAIWIDGNMTS